MRDLHENPRTIPGTRITPLRATMVKILQDLKPLLNDLMRLVALNIGHKADATPILLITGIIKTLLRGHAI